MAKIDTTIDRFYCATCGAVEYVSKSHDKAPGSNKFPANALKLLNARHKNIEVDGARCEGQVRFVKGSSEAPTLAAAIRCHQAAQLIVQMLMAQASRLSYRTEIETRLTMDAAEGIEAIGVFIGFVVGSKAHLSCPGCMGHGRIPDADVAQALEMRGGQTVLPWGDDVELSLNEGDPPTPLFHTCLICGGSGETPEEEDDGKRM